MLTSRITLSGQPLSDSLLLRGRSQLSDRHTLHAWGQVEPWCQTSREMIVLMVVEDQCSELYDTLK